jgi:hypothetical protein
MEAPEFRASHCGHDWRGVYTRLSGRRYHRTATEEHSLLWAGQLRHAGLAWHRRASENGRVQRLPRDSRCSIVRSHVVTIGDACLVPHARSSRSAPSSNRQRCRFPWFHSFDATAFPVRQGLLRAVLGQIARTPEYGAGLRVRSGKRSSCVRPRRRRAGRSPLRQAGGRIRAIHPCSA